MPRATQTTIQCINCRTPFRATINALIDPAQNPQAKIALLAGGANTFPCTNCGTPNTVLTPLLYHDASKELLVSFVPMELGLSKDAQEKAIGDLMRDLTTNLPQGAFKAYMLQPRSALTMQGLIEQVLQADGVTPEMMQAQRERVRLVEMFIQSPPEVLPSLVQQHDAQIDAQFMQTMTLIIQQLASEGREALADQVVDVQNTILELSSFGQTLMERAQAQETTIASVAEDINALGQNAQRSDFIQLAVRYADDPERLQALVGLIRPAFDYTFFQEFTTAISQAPASERDRIQGVREALLELTAQVDQQAQMALQEAANLLRLLLSSPNPDELIAANLPMIDYTFLQVLSANIQEATRRGDVSASGRLKDLYNRVVAALQASMPPELRFINEVLNAPTDAEALEMVNQRAVEFGSGLLDALDSVEQQLAGQPNPAIMERFEAVRRLAVQTLSG